MSQISYIGTDNWDVNVKSKTLFFSGCECNEWSSRCRFNEQMFQETGKGGECMDCEGNKAGQHCDRCKADHYESKVQDEKGRTPCEPCLCDEPGKLVCSLW